MPYQVVAQDRVEFLNGSELQGKVEQIRQKEKEFDFRATIAGREVTKTYAYRDVHAVTFGGKRYELTPKPSTDSKQDGDQRPLRSQVEVQQIIADVGGSLPDWYESTELNLPASLDLSWPMKPDGPWDASKNVGQYIWDRVNPNESRWKAGIKLVHECMKRHEDDPALLKRDSDKLGVMYFTLLQDYPRAAYWLQKGEAKMNQASGIHLAECYWRLGSRDMALEAMRGSFLHWSAIKLLGDMGEIEDALRVTDVYAKTQAANEAFLNAGDALRGAGRLDEAVEYYQKVVDDDTQARNEDYKMRFQARAAGAIEAIRLFDRADVSKIADGTYRDRSTGYNGELQVEVRVAKQRIESVRVTQHKEKQFYAALTDTTQQILDSQGVQDIDGTSGATITSQAIVHATAKALAQGAQ